MGYSSQIIAVEDIGFKSELINAKMIH